MRTEAGRGGRPRLLLRADDGGQAEIYLHGAHVTSWTTPDGREQLFLSERAVFDGAAAIRGGVPVIFPQFAGEGPLPKHGFARGLPWRLIDAAVRGGTPYATLELVATGTTRAIWPHDFRLTYRVELVEGTLRMSLTAHNAGDAPFTFTAALHTYLRLDDAFAACLRGLEGVRFRDSAPSAAPAVQRDPELCVEGEVNRIYLDVPGVVDVVDGRREIRSTMRGFRDVVVWNPGAEGERALTDMEPGGARRMLCLEAGAIGEPVTVGPNESWTGAQRLSAATLPAIPGPA